jgi:hypothetical protein
MTFNRPFHLIAGFDFHCLARALTVPVEEGTLDVKAPTSHI